MGKQQTKGLPPLPAGATFVDQADTTGMPPLPAGATFVDDVKKKEDTVVDSDPGVNRFSLGRNPFLDSRQILSDKQSVARFPYNADQTVEFATPAPPVSEETKAKEPAGPDDDQSYIGELGESLFERGLARLYSMVSKVPSFLYTIASVPQNAIADAGQAAGVDLEAIRPMTPAQITERTGIDNPVANYYDKVAAESQAKQTAKYNNTITGFISEGDYTNAAKLAGNQIAESIPVMVGIAATRGAGVSSGATVVGGGAVFGAQKYSDIQNTNLPENVKVFNATLTGLTEGVLENLGTGKIVDAGREILASSGKEAAQAFFKQSFSEMYKTALRKLYVVTAPIAEGVEEAATTFSQNAIDKYSGVNPNVNLTDGMLDSFIVGAGSGVAMSAPISAYSKIVNRGNRVNVITTEAANNRIVDDLANPALAESSRALLTSQFMANNESMNAEVERNDAKLKALPEGIRGQVNENLDQISALESVLTDPNVSSEVKVDTQLNIDKLHEEVNNLIPAPVEATDVNEDISENTVAAQEPIQGVERIKGYINDLSNDNYLFTHVTREEDAKNITDGNFNINLGTGVSSTLSQLNPENVGSQIERLANGEVVHRDNNNNSLAVIAIPKSILDGGVRDKSEALENWLSENTQPNSDGSFSIPREYNVGYLSGDTFINANQRSVANQNTNNRPVQEAAPVSVESTDPDIVREVVYPHPEYGDVQVAEKKDGTFDITFDEGSTDNYTQQEVIDNFNFNPVSDIENEADYRLENTTDANEVAAIYDEKLNELNDTGNIDGAIAAYDPSFTDDEFANYNDRNNLTSEIRSRYKSKRESSLPLDVQAQEINDLYFNGNEVVSPEDVANFAVAYPKGVASYYNQAGNTDLKAIGDKYTELTGKKLKKDVAIRLAQKYNASQETVSAAQQQVDDETDLYNRVIDQEFSLTEGFITADEVADNLNNQLDSYVADPGNDFNIFHPTFKGEVVSPELISQIKTEIDGRRINQGTSSEPGSGSNVGGESDVISETNTGADTETGDGTSVTGTDTNVEVADDAVVTPESQKTLSDTIRSLKVRPGNLYDGILGLPIAIYNGALETVATAIEAGQSLASAVKRAVDYIKSNSELTDDQTIQDELMKDLRSKGLVYTDRQAVLNDKLLTVMAKQAVEYIRRGVKTPTDFAKKIGKGVNDAQVREGFKLAQAAITANPTNPRAEIDNMMASRLQPEIKIPARGSSETKAEYVKRVAQFKKDQAAPVEGPKNLKELNDFKRELRDRLNSFVEGYDSASASAQASQESLDQEYDKIRQQVIGIVDLLKKDKNLNSTISGKNKILSVVQRVAEAGNNPNKLYEALDYAIKVSEHADYDGKIANAKNLRAEIYKKYYMGNQARVSELNAINPELVPSELLDEYSSMMEDIANDNIKDWTKVSDMSSRIKADWPKASIENNTGIVPYVPTPDYMREKKTWYESLKDKFSKFRREWLDFRRGLPKDVYALQEQATGIVGAEVKRAMVTATTLDNLLSKDKSISAADVDLALRGDTEAMNRLPDEVAETVAVMRNHVDSLSSVLITSGLITPSQMATVEVNLGKYLTRSYRLYEDSDWTLDNLPDSVYNRAADFLFKKYYPEVKAELPGAAEEDVSAVTLERVKAKINEYFNKTENEFFKPGKIGSKDLSLMDQRKNVPEPIRALFGEVTDPLTNYVHTVFKVANLAANAQFLNRLKSEFDGVYFFDEKNVNRTADHNVKIASEGSETMSPLNGMYTTPEIAKAFTNIDNKTSAFWEGYKKVIGSVKAGKTIGSVITHIKNVEGNLGFVLTNGHFDGGEFGKAFKATSDELLSKDTKEIKELILPLIQLGVIKQSVGAGEIRSMFSPDGIFGQTYFNNTGKERSNSGKVINQAKRLAKFTANLYEAEDNFFKVFAYLNDRKRYSEALYDKPYEDLVPEERKYLDTYVAELVKNTYPTFSRVPEIARAGSKYLPVMGNFVSFAAESYRVGYNIAKQIYTELRSDNKKIRLIGAKRLAGVTVYQGVKVALLKMIGSAGVGGLIGLLGGDDEEEKRLADATKRYVAPWSINSDKIVMPGKSGKFRYIDMSSYDPFGNASSVINALTNAKTPEQAIGGIVGEFLGPFMDEEITYKTINNLTNNKDEYDRVIFQPQDDFKDKVSKGFLYAVKQLEPGTLSTIRRASEGGVKPLDLFYRTSDVDVAKQFFFKSKDTKEAIESVKKIYSETYYNKNSTKADIDAAYKKNSDKIEKIVAEAQKDYEAAVFLGADVKGLRKVLKDTRLNSGLSKMITSGKIKDGGLLKKRLEK